MTEEGNTTQFSHQVKALSVETSFIIVFLLQHFFLYYLSSDCIRSSAVQSFVRKLAKLIKYKRLQPQR